MKRGGTFVLELQLVMFDAFQQAHRAMVSKKPDYSIQKPPSSNKPTLDGHIDSESDQVLIKGKKAYIVNYFRTTCRITVNGSRTATFLREDIQEVLNMLSGLSTQQVATLTRQAYDAIQACKSTLSQDSNPSNLRGICDTGPGVSADQAADLMSQQSGSNPQMAQQSVRSPNTANTDNFLSIRGPPSPAGADSQAGSLTQAGALVRPSFQPAEVHIDQRILNATDPRDPQISIPTSVIFQPAAHAGDIGSPDQQTTTSLALPPPVVSPGRVNQENLIRLQPPNPDVQDGGRAQQQSTEGSRGGNGTPDQQTGEEEPLSERLKKLRKEQKDLEKAKRELKVQQKAADQARQEAATLRTLSLDLETRVKELEESLRKRDAHGPHSNPSQPYQPGSNQYVPPQNTAFQFPPWPYPSYPPFFPYPYPPPPSPMMSTEVTALREEVSRLSGQLRDERERVFQLERQIQNDRILEADRAHYQKTKIMELERKLEEDYRRRDKWRNKKFKQPNTPAGTTVFEYNHISPPRRQTSHTKRNHSEVRESSCQTEDSDIPDGPTTSTRSSSEATSSSGHGIDPVYTSRAVGTSPHKGGRKATNVGSPPAAAHRSADVINRVPVKTGSQKIEVIRPRTFSGSSDGSYEDASSETGSFLEETRSPSRSK